MCIYTSIPTLLSPHIVVLILSVRILSVRILSVRIVLVVHNTYELVVVLRFCVILVCVFYE